MPIQETLSIKTEGKITPRMVIGIALIATSVAVAVPGLNTLDNVRAEKNQIMNSFPQSSWQYEIEQRGLPKRQAEGNTLCGIALATLITGLGLNIPEQLYRKTNPKTK